MQTKMTPIWRYLPALSAVWLSAVALPAVAMVEITDEQMSEVSGAGLAFAAENFRFQMAPTSYIEQIGGPPGAGTSFNRGDLRWYGLTISGGGGNGQTWQGTNCASAGLNNMGCPMSNTGIANFANHDNPYVLRVFEYVRVGDDPNVAGLNWIGDPVVNGTSANGVPRTVLELLGPSNMDTFRWAFWGEIEASKGGVVNAPGTAGILQNQNIIRGKAAAREKPPSIFGVNNTTNPFEGPVLQLFQNQSDSSLGLLYHSRLSGDYRFSVNQTGADALGVPQFTNEEGLYFTNVNAYLPLGTLHYQSVVLDDTPAKDGNFVIELTRLPNDVQAYNDAYSVADPGTAIAQRGYQRTGRNDRYYETHGYVEWGSAFPTCPGGTTNCLPGSGVSSQRFAGLGDSVGGTLTLPARVVNSTNFTGNLCDGAGTFGGYGGCDRWDGTTAPAVTVNLGGSVSPTGSQAQVVAAGGMAFVSRSGGTWTVVNNQNRAATGIADKNAFLLTLQNDLEVKRARTDTREVRCGFGCTDYELYADTTPDTATIQARANALSPYGGNYNPTLTVNAINLGTSRISGMLIQHLKITSLGAN